MTLRTQRRVQRAIHLLAAVVLAVFIYSPLGDQDAFQVTVRFVTLPILIVTGLGLWLLPKWTASRRRSAASARTPR